MDVIDRSRNSDVRVRKWRLFRRRLWGFSDMSFEVHGRSPNTANLEQWAAECQTAAQELHDRDTYFFLLLPFTKNSTELSEICHIISM
jgi:hypothetical protein